MPSLNQKVEVPIVLAGKYKIKPEKRERFLELARAGLTATLQEPGNISYDLYEDIQQANTFIYFEEWQSREALQDHLKQPYIVPLIEEIADLLAEKPNVRVYDIDNLTYGLD